MSEIKQVTRDQNGRSVVYRVKTEDGVWYTISENDFHALEAAKFQGFMRFTVLPGVVGYTERTNLAHVCRDNPEDLEARVKAAKQELARLAEKLDAVRKALMEAM